MKIIIIKNEKKEYIIMRAKPLKGIIFYILISLPSIGLLISLILSFNNSNFAVMRDFLKISFPIYTSIIISLISGTYRHFFLMPWLDLDLENSRNYLIDEFDIEESEQTTGVYIKQGESIKARAKYLRINLKNKGKETAKNCRIKLHIYYQNYELVREPSNLYPSGFHHFKKDRKTPPFIDIAAGDSQIFDICSTTNITSERNVIRFEDYFNYSRIEVKNNPLILDGIKLFYIKLFVYSDNNSPFERRYKIFKKPEIDTYEWRQIDIKQFDWEKNKKEMKNSMEKAQIHKDIELIKKKENKTPKEVYQPHDFSQKSYDNNNKYDEQRKEDYTTGL